MAETSSIAKEVQVWVRALRFLGVDPSVALAFCKSVEQVYVRLVVVHPWLKPRPVFRAIVSGFFSGMLPVFSVERLTDRLLASDLQGLGDLVPVVQEEASRVVSQIPDVGDRLVQVLVAREDVSSELSSTLAQLQLLLTQQHQVLRKHYPFSGGDSLSAELLGTRMVQEHLGEDLLDRVYVGLNELCRALRSSGNWMNSWDSQVQGTLNLVATRSFFEQVGRVMSVLDATQYAALKRLYRLKWLELDGRMLANLDTKFSWRPLV